MTLSEWVSSFLTAHQHIIDDLEPVTLTFKLVLDSGKVNRRARCLDQGSFRSAVLDTHTRPTDCSTGTTKVDGKNEMCMRVRARAYVCTICTTQTGHWASTSTRWHLRSELYCHTNETRGPIANLPNSAQLEGTLSYHCPSLHSGPCSSVRMRWGTDRHTDTQTAVTNIHFTSATPHTECNDSIGCGSVSVTM